MPLTEEQLKSINQMMDGYTDGESVHHKGMQDLLTEIVVARDKLIALPGLHLRMLEANALDTLSDKKAEAKSAADELSALLA